MNVVELAPGVFHLRGGSNMGLVVREGRGLLIDTGLDEDAARRALRFTEGEGVQLEAVFLTHAHADHHGGAHFLQRRLGVPLYAPVLEAAMMENPVMEPLFLFGGAAPIRELRQKFTMAQPCEIARVVDAGPLEVGPFRIEVVPLPGHALNQMGIAVDGVLFCADAVFPQETLEKHKIIFCADMDAALGTLARLPDMPYTHFAPGHGPAYRAGDEIREISAANRTRLEEIRERVREALTEPLGTEDLIQGIASSYGLRLTTATAYFLARATILAALSSLERAGEVRAEVEENRLKWRKAI
ncbi:MAG: MBL fold metallo-hydrolase [Anaerolineae bacterium]|nr:MBL fold metallo-hydrolase [Anaerolineae bacterium]MCX8068171.1 MBL fold metallo-hydrolase [Anaerolineae bacterium]MDW7991189.1 MBL fold metallo-hydrolase [Anaerolineae bacterium]